MQSSLRRSPRKKKSLKKVLKSDVSDQVKAVKTPKRRSKKTSETKDDHPAEEAPGDENETIKVPVDVSQDDDDDAMETTTGETPEAESENQTPEKESCGSAQKTVTSARALRRKRREQQRSRNMGIGLQINVAKKNSEITFQDIEDATKESEEEEEESGEDKVENDEQAQGQEDEDDDAVEEVRTSLARDQAMEQRAKERETAVLQELETKKKKRKRIVVESDVPEELDEEFFAQVDSDLATQRRQKRRVDKGVAVKPVGKHTTFVAADDDDQGGKHGGHNIEVVVLRHESQTLEGKMGTEPSETAELFSRSKLLGNERITKGHNHRETNEGWRRSKKMNRVLSASTKGRRRSPAPHFVVQG